MIRVQSAPAVPLHNFWNNFHFHPTDAIEDDWGRRILDTAAADRVGDTVRMYAMLEDIVSMDETGELRYDFTLNDTRLDYMLSKGYGIFLSYNFIPPCIASDPGVTSSVSKNKTRYKGKRITTSVPKDWALWEEICYRYTAHIVARYGADVVSQWRLQCYNEPDVVSFFMTELGPGEAQNLIRLENYKKLYAGFERGVLRACPDLHIGGPSIGGGRVFMDGFLDFIKTGNHRLDFVCFHTYGTGPHALNDGTGRFHAENTLKKHQAMQAIIDKYFPEGIEVIVDEWGAATCGFWNREECPALMLREDSRFAAYYGKMITAYVNAGVKLSKLMICLSGQHEMTTDFSGFRGFFTLHFIKKPIYNAYVLTRKLRETRVPASCGNPDASVLASRGADGSGAVLVSYASEYFDSALPDLDETVEIEGVTGRRHVTVWCIDEQHTNPCRYAEERGWDDPQGEQVEVLRRVAELQPLYEADMDADGTLRVPVHCTNNALLLIEF